MWEMHSIRQSDAVSIKLKQDPHVARSEPINVHLKTRGFGSTARHVANIDV